jgi:hypothetical protein
MRRSLIVLFVCALARAAGAAVFTEDFDDSAKWVSDNMIGYNQKQYSNDSPPAGDGWIMDSGVREATYARGGSGYAWRIRNEASRYFRYELPSAVTLVSFSLQIADWDVSDGNTWLVRCSEDSGAAWTTLLSGDSSWFTGDGLGDRQYKLFESGDLYLEAQAGEAVFVEVLNTGGLERLLVDDMTVTYLVPEPASLVLVLFGLGSLALGRKK